jgi:hypothetical protein
MDASLVAHLSPEPKVSAHLAVSRSAVFVQKQFGPLYGMHVTQSELVWLRRELHKGETGETALVHQVTLTAKVDLNHFRDCLEAEGGMAPLVPDVSDTHHEVADITATSASSSATASTSLPSHRALKDRDGVDDGMPRKASHHEGSKQAMRARCMHHARAVRHSMEAVHEHMASQGMSHDNVLGEYTMPEKTHYVGAAASVTTRRLIVFVDAHDGRVLQHYDKDINKFTAIKESSGVEAQAVLKERTTRHLRSVAAEKAAGRGRHPKPVVGARNVLDDDNVGPYEEPKWEPRVVVYDCAYDYCNPDERETAEWLLFDSETDDISLATTEVQVAVASTIYTARLYKTVSANDHPDTVDGANPNDPTWYSYKEVNETTFKVFVHDNMLNAYWDGERAVFGTGMVDDDIVAHEWSHAYTEYTSGLHYFYQSGAINEAMSDIFGETVDILNTGLAYDGNGMANWNGFESGVPDSDTIMLPRYDINSSYSTCSNKEYPFMTAQPTSGDNNSTRWVLGEGAYYNLLADYPEFPPYPVGPFRDMWSPECFDNPSTLPPWKYAKDNAQEGSGSYYVCYDADAGGVHTNSGVPAHAYAMMVDGGTVRTPDGTNMDDTFEFTVPNDDARYNVPTYTNTTTAGWGINLASSFMWQMQEDYFFRMEGLQMESFGFGLLDWCNTNVGTVNLFYPPNLVNGTTAVDDQGVPIAGIITQANCDSLESIVLATRLTRQEFCVRGDVNGGVDEYQVRQGLPLHLECPLCSLPLPLLTSSPPPRPRV